MSKSKRQRTSACGAPWKPTKDELAAAYGKTITDVIAPGLKVLFCGINPGLYSGAVGHHFARPGNRFWPTLHAAGFSDRVLSPFEERALLEAGFGITNIVNRATATADQLSSAELVTGAGRLARKVKRFAPAVLAFLGLSAYRVAFARPKAVIGPQLERVGSAALWVLPNPSGLNAHYQLPELARLFQELRRSVERPGGIGAGLYPAARACESQREFGKERRPWPKKRSTPTGRSRPS
jgi:double-stranded uracil-DNA glycosylase